MGLPEALRRFVQTRSPDTPVRFTTLEQHLAENVATPRFRTMLLAAFAGGAQGQGSENAPGATTPAQAQTIEGGLQQLSAPAGQSLAAPTQDSYKGSVVEGKATGEVLDLSLDDAIAQYQQAVDINPGYLKAHYSLGIAFYQEGKTNEAIIHFQKVLALAQAAGRPDIASQISAALRSLGATPAAP